MCKDCGEVNEDGTMDPIHYEGFVDGNGKTIIGGEIVQTYKLEIINQYCFACGLETQHMGTIDGPMEPWCVPCNKRDDDTARAKEDERLNAQILAEAWGSLAAEEIATSEEDARLYFNKYGSDMTEDAVKHIKVAAHYANIYFKEVA